MTPQLTIAQFASDILSKTANDSAFNYLLWRGRMWNRSFNIFSASLAEAGISVTGGKVEAGPLSLKRGKGIEKRHDL